MNCNVDFLHVKILEQLSKNPKFFPGLKMGKTDMNENQSSEKYFFSDFAWKKHGRRQATRICQQKREW